MFTLHNSKLFETLFKTLPRSIGSLWNRVQWVYSGISFIRLNTKRGEVVGKDRKRKRKKRHNYGYF